MSDAGAIATGVVFLLYMAAMLAPALYSGRMLRKSTSFLSEYFLGSRSMSSWLLAMSFAATCISGGTFAGFPSKIYSHGWILLLWIGSYMVFPLVSMGLMGKRLNTLSRQTGAITVPDILRDRFQSSSLAIFGSLAIALFLIVNLVSQFKAGGLILDVLLRDTPGYTSHILPWVENWPGVTRAVRDLGAGYVLSLFLFAGIVVLYTSYGGFRAVVWTDTLQGIVMLVGVLILMPTVLWAAGGLSGATRKVAESPPTTTIGTFEGKNAVEYRGKQAVGKDLYVLHVAQSAPQADTTVTVNDSPNSVTIVVHARTDQRGQVVATAREVCAAVARSPDASLYVDAVLPRPDGQSNEVDEKPVPTTPSPQYLMQARDRLFGPSRTRDGSPFHPLGMVISFFILWPISSAGHPGFLMRLMAFRNSRDLRYAIAMVTVYFTLTYIPLVLIFVAAQTLVNPASLSGGPDAVMPTVAKQFAHPVLAGLLLAAPFSAVMSTVSSFLLVISSSLVRDIYQRTIRREFSERGVHALSQLTTLAIGVFVAWLALDPPRFLQDIVVLTSEGLAATFLVATFLGIYWPRMTTAGAWGAMTTGFAVMVGSHLPPLLARVGAIDHGEPIHYAGIDPFPIALAASLAIGVVLSLLSTPPADRVVRTYFSRKNESYDAKGSAAPRVVVGSVAHSDEGAHDSV